MDKAVCYCLLSLFAVITVVGPLDADTCSEPNNPLEAKAETVFQLGDTVNVEIVLPRSGFVGSPERASGAPKRPKKPTKDEDFYRRYFRLTTIKQYPIQSDVRVVLQLDEIAPHPEYGTEPVYYAVIEISEETTRIIGIDPDEGLIGPHVVALGTGIVRGARHGLPFPLVMTCPLALTEDKSMKHNGAMMPGDYGVVYSESTITTERPFERRIGAELFQRWDPRMPGKSRHMRYYDEEDKMISEAVGEGRVKVRILARETQLWSSDDDWLWETMERYDADGNIMMRCRRMKAGERVDTSPARHGIGAPEGGQLR